MSPRLNPMPKLNDFLGNGHMPSAIYSESTQPLCFTLTIYDQKIVSGSLFLTYNYFLINIFIFFLAIYNVTFQCGC